MSIRSQIAKYALVNYGKRSDDASAIARIALYNHTSQFIGNIQFYRDGQPIPDNYSVETFDPKRVFLRMHENQVDTVVDMLRNEKPCAVYYSSPTYAYLYTGKEPVGEEESEE